MDKALQSLSEWVSSNPDVPDHIKHQLAVANGVEASGALPSTGGLVEHEDLTSDSSSSTSESSSK